jgi:hypothetical protein
MFCPMKSYGDWNEKQSPTPASEQKAVGAYFRDKED